jgi:hypothetical protein
MKRIREDKPIGVIIHIYKETTHVAIFISNRLKCHSFYFFFYIMGEKEGRTSPAQGEGLAPEQGGRCWGEVVGG